MLKAACALLLVAALLGGNPGGAGLHSAGGGALAGILGGAAAAAALPPEAAAGVRLPPLPNGFLFPVLAYGELNVASCIVDVRCGFWAGRRAIASMRAGPPNPPWPTHRSQ